MEVTIACGLHKSSTSVLITSHSSFPGRHLDADHGSNEAAHKDGIQERKEDTSKNGQKGKEAWTEVRERVSSPTWPIAATRFWPLDKCQVPFITGQSTSNWLRPGQAYDDDVDEQLSTTQIKKLQLA